MIRIPPQRGGWLEVICGPMFSGKSEEMIRRLRRAEIAGPAGRHLQAADRRPLRRDRRREPRGRANARRSGLSVSEIAAHAAEPRRRRDRRGAVPRRRHRRRARSTLADHGTRVIVAGLDQDFRRLPFGPMPELLSHAEFVDKLQAVCHRCGGPATTTQRLVDGRPAPVLGRHGRRRGGGAVRGALPRLPRARHRRGPGGRVVSARRTALVASATRYTAAATSTIVPPGGRSA